jgi:CPA2 family monovalent cation:H+ antiporter-2
MDSAHPGIEFLGQIGIVLVAALIGGLVARALRLPVLIGYLLAGIVIGPHTPGFIAHEETVKTVADLGVALLMFAVGVQFSLDELNHVRRIALIGGGAQILGTVALGLGLGVLFGWGVYGGLFLGCALALSSTAVMLKCLKSAASWAPRTATPCSASLSSRTCHWF